LSWEIRQLRSIDGVFDCLNAASDLPTAYRTESLIVHLGHNDWLWGIFANQQLAGFALYRPICDEAELLYFYVLPGFRRLGFGAKLLHASSQYLKEREMKRVFLEVSDVNHRALSLYRDAGFQRVGIRESYYSDGSSAIVMSKGLEDIAD